jgi:hypothetical protein
MNARVPPVPSRTNASTINTGIFISTSLTVVPDTVQVNRWADEPEMNAQKSLEEPQAGNAMFRCCPSQLLWKGGHYAGAGLSHQPVVQDWVFGSTVPPKPEPKFRLDVHLANGTPGSSLTWQATRMLAGRVTQRSFRLYAESEPLPYAKKSERRLKLRRNLMAWLSDAVAAQVNCS